MKMAYKIANLFLLLSLLALRSSVSLSHLSFFARVSCSAVWTAFVHFVYFVFFIASGRLVGRSVGRSSAMANLITVHTHTTGLVTSCSARPLCCSCSTAVVSLWIAKATSTRAEQRKRYVVASDCVYVRSRREHLYVDGIATLKQTKPKKEQKKRRIKLAARTSLSIWCGTVWHSIICILQPTK